MDDLRETIARAILMVTQGNVPVEDAWNAQFSYVQDEILQQADALIEALGLREERRPGVTTTLNDSVWTRPDKRRYITDWGEVDE